MNFSCLSILAGNLCGGIPLYIERDIRCNYLMLDMSNEPSIKELMSFIRHNPGAAIPAKHLKPILEMLAEASTVLNFYARESSWFPIRSTPKFTFYAMTEGDATKRSRIFLTKWGMGSFQSDSLPQTKDRKCP